MHVAVVLIIRNFLKVGARGAGPVRYGIGVSRDRTLENVGKEDHIILPDAVSCLWRDRCLELLTVTPVMPASFDLIVSAPDDDAGMIPQALNLVDSLLPDVFLEGGVARNHVASEHEFLPNHNAEFIANIVEIIGLVVTATPFPNHVHVSVASGLE